MKECACYPCCYSDQVALAGEDFNLAGAGEFGEVHCASAADVGRGHLIGCNCGQSGQQFARMNAQAFEFRFGAKAFQFVDRVSVLDGEFGDGRAAERLEMGSAAQCLPDIVGHGTHVSARSHPSAKAGTIVFEGEEIQLFDLDFYGLKSNFLLLAGEFIRRNAFNLFRREWWRSLCDDSLEAGGGRIELFPAEIGLRRRAGGFAFGVVRGGRESETNRAFVGLLRHEVELRKPCEAADHKRQDSCRHGIECSEMSDGTLVQNSPSAADDVVRG